MPSVVEISCEVIKKFDPSESEIEEIINKLKGWINKPKKAKKKAIEKTADDIEIEGFENWLKKKWSKPKIKNS